MGSSLQAWRVRSNLFDFLWQSPQNAGGPQAFGSCGTEVTEAKKRDERSKEIQNNHGVFCFCFDELLYSKWQQFLVITKQFETGWKFYMFVGTVPLRLGIRVPLDQMRQCCGHFAFASKCRATEDRWGHPDRMFGSSRKIRPCRWALPLLDFVRYLHLRCIFWWHFFLDHRESPWWTGKPPERRLSEPQLFPIAKLVKRTW